MWPLWVGNRPPSLCILVTSSFSGDHPRPGVGILHSTVGSRAWQRAGFGILLCVQLLHRTVCNVNSIQSPQTFHCIRSILSPFPEPPREPSLVACQTGSTPNVWSSVSIVDCHSPIEPHVQSSGCEIKETIVEGSWRRKTVPRIPQAMGDGLSTRTDLGRPEGKKTQKPRTKANTSFLLPSYHAPNLCCWRLKIDYCLGASDYKPICVEFSCEIRTFLVEPMESHVIKPSLSTCHLFVSFPGPKTLSPFLLLSLLPVNSCFIRWRACSGN